MPDPASRLPIDEIVKLEQLEGSELNEAKKVLANHATELCHSKQAAIAAAESARAAFEVGGFAPELPTVAVSRDELASGIAAFEMFAEAKLVSSKGAARRLIRGGGGRVNDRLIKSETETITLADLDPNGYIKLSAGRKRHALVRPV